MEMNFRNIVLCRPGSHKDGSVTFFSLKCTKVKWSSVWTRFVFFKRRLLHGFNSRTEKCCHAKLPLKYLTVLRKRRENLFFLIRLTAQEEPQMREMYNETV